MQPQMIEDRFNAAVRVIRSLPKDGPYQPSQDMMLKFYGLFKQATEGPCKESKPSFYEVVKGYKWRAWSSLGNMTKMEAMNTYVEELKKIVETMTYSEDVASFIEVLGPFYEYIELHSNQTSDDNHNITDKILKKDPLDKESSTYEMISLCNGKNNQDLNGVLGLNDEDNIVPDNQSVMSKVDSTKEKRSKTHERIPNKHVMNGDSIFVNGTEVKIDSNEVEDAFNHKIESFSYENGIKNTHFYTLKKVTSDTESDEEYSEPAETPELLQQKQKQKRRHINLKTKNDTSPNMANLSFQNDSPILEIVTCGGGDAADAGRIRMVQAHQSQQGHLGSRSKYSSGDEAISANHTITGEGSRRRRRDSDDPRTTANTDVNDQLIYILQKIHQDLEAVVFRLDSLESRTLSRHHDVCALCQRRLGLPFTSETWWPFPELSFRSTIFLLIWPLIIHGGVKLLRYLRVRRLRDITSYAHVKRT